MFRRTTPLCLLFASCKNGTFWGLCTQAGGYDPRIRTRPRCLYNTPTTKFHHPIAMFTRSEVIVLTHKQTYKPTNKQTPPKTSNVLRYATTSGNQNNKSAQSNLGRGPRRSTVAHVHRTVPICYNGAPQIRPQKYPFPWTDLQTPLPASSLDPSDL